jgi:hypothetical protein
LPTIAIDAKTNPATAPAMIRAIVAHAPRRGLIAGLLLSIAVHVAFSFWPVEAETTPDVVPLQASITELPPPPKPVAAATAKPRPKPQRATATRRPAEPVEPIDPVATTEPEAPPIEPTPEAIATGPEPPTEIVAAEPADAVPEAPAKTLPRRVDLVYKAFLGTQGFLVGEAIYRFEHAGNEYHITTIGEAKGLAALFVRGQGKLESRGLITAAGLRPHEFAVERGSRERRETAVFDWEIGMVTLFEQKTEALELSTFDPLTLMWQAYFSPPVDDVQDISIATTRRVGRYTLTREAEETITWSQGEILTERWRRRSDDGNLHATLWLAPSLRYVPVKMRVTASYRNTFETTLEATLDSIRVDETVARQ